MGRGLLECGEAGVKVGDNDLGLMTSESGEKTFSSRQKSSSLKGEVVSQARYLFDGVFLVSQKYSSGVFPTRIFFLFFPKTGGKFKMTLLAR